jgi:hypothetical protein
VQVTWWSFTSTTLEMSLLEDEQFCGKRGERTIFMISTTLGFDIKAFSFYEAEAEILLPPGLTFEVTGHMELGHGLVVVQMRQAAAPPRRPAAAAALCIHSPPASADRLAPVPAARRPRQAAGGGGGGHAAAGPAHRGVRRRRAGGPRVARRVGGDVAGARQD